MSPSPALAGSGLVGATLLWVGVGGGWPCHDAPSPHTSLSAAEAVAPVALLQEVPDQPEPWQLRVDRETRTIAFEARVQAEAFRASLPPDHQYHAIVHAGGGAAGKSLLVTQVPDTEVAAVLRELGAEDGGGVPMAAWSLRWVPLVSAPNSRVRGSRLSITVTWPGAPWAYRLEELLHDSGGRGAEWRFGGNEEHDDQWHSGCILCLFSCPGGVMSNAAYSIRDHQRAATVFEPLDLLPPDGTEVTVTISLQSG